MRYFIRVRPGNRFSEGAKLLARELGAKRSTSPGPFKSLKDVTVVNWGDSHPIDRTFEGDRLFFVNHPFAVQMAANKRGAFIALENSQVACPEYRKTKESAIEELRSGRWHSIFCRTVLTGSGGQGIVHARTPEQVIDAPLYVQYIPKSQEFRVHVLNDQVIFSQEKRKRNGIEANKQIRSHDNGWVFCFKDVVLPEGAAQICIDAVRALGLDFGAVDLIYSKGLNKSFVLEVNTAPGLCETSAKLYADAIRNAYR